MIGESSLSLSNELLQKLIYFLFFSWNDEIELDSLRGQYLFIAFSLSLKELPTQGSLTPVRIDWTLNFFYFD